MSGQRTMSVGPSASQVGREVLTRGPARSRGQVDVRWTIDRRAFERARPGLIGAGSSPVELRWRISQESGAIVATASIVDAEEEKPRVTPLLASRAELLLGEPVWIDDGQMVHIDLPGLIVVSLRHEQDGIHLLYARTRLLENLLALPGGRYEPVSASVR